jgi:hypothetical protein
MMIGAPFATTVSGTLEKMIGCFGTAPFTALESKPLRANSCACSW